MCTGNETGVMSPGRRPGSRGGQTVIRPERSGDEPHVAAVVEQAFGSPARARLVAKPESAGYIPELSLVAEVAARIGGHVMVREAVLRDGGVERPVAMLSPLAVAPSSQRLGIGSALVRLVTDRADHRGEPMVVLEGSPAFYTRLGFEQPVPLGIQLPLPSWAPPEAAQVLRLQHFDPTLRGDVMYPPAFRSFGET